MRPRRLAPLCTVLLASACGGLETPDLGHGDVVGVLVGAAPGASAYPLGAPDLKVAIGADGRFALHALPVGPVRLVVFDGVDRAELVQLQVVGAGRTHLARSAADMPLAGRGYLSVAPEGGVLPLTSRYAARGTDQAGLVSPSGGVALYPLAGGDYELEAVMDGFQGGLGSLHVTAGQTSGLELRLPVAMSGPLGCAAPGATCRNDLKCDPADGHCYPCRLGADDCGPGASCDPETRLCASAVSSPAPPVCSRCAADGDCGGAAAGAYCELAAGATSGYCSRRGGCPAGFQLDATDPAALRCRALQGCHAYLDEFGEHCFSDETCGERDGIAGGFCRGADRERGVPGHCTAACAGDADCFVSGFSCHPVERVCVRPEWG